MKDVKRYEFEVYQMSFHHEGDYVSYDDYAELKEQRDALAAENKVLDSAIGAIADAYETGLKDLLAQEIDTAVNTTTPATDAYLNSVRAEGVEMVKAHPAISLCSLTHVCEEIAAQLRAGEPS